MPNLAPPTTRFACNVGVAGRGPLATEVLPALAGVLADLLSILRETAATCLAKAPTGLYTSGPPILRCLSTLAEGAGRVAVEQALAGGYEVQACLPYPRMQYAATFPDESRSEFHAQLSKATAVLELDGNGVAQSNAILAAERTVLEQSDILIAVWRDTGEKAHVGTGRLVNEAQARGIPVIAVDPSDPAAARFLWSCATGDLTHDLGVCLERMVLPPEAPLTPAQNGSRLTRTIRLFFTGRPTTVTPALYFKEKWPRPTLLGLVPGWFEKLLSRTKQVTASKTPLRTALRKGVAYLGSWLRCLVFGSRVEDSALAEADIWSKALGLRSEATERVLLQHYAWADQLAIHYAMKYRALGLLRHLLMLLVIIGLFVGFYVEKGEGWGFGMQAGAFLCILGLVKVNTVKNWQQRFLDYRYLAEELRHMRYLFFLGRLPAFAHDGPEATCTRESWPAWHLRNVARQAGLVNAQMEPPLLNSYHGLLETRVIDDQMRYYAERRDRYELLHRRLNTIGTNCFRLGLGIIIMRFVVFSLIKPDQTVFFLAQGNGLRTVTNEIALVVPAFASMFFALASQGEYSRLSKRYVHMWTYLAHQQQVLRALSPLTSMKLADFAESVAAVLSHEVSDWHILVKNKALTSH